MSFESPDYLSRHFQTSGTDLYKRINEISTMATPGGSSNLPLYREMLLTVTRMAQADRNRWDAKIMLQTLKEMERAFSLLERFKRRRKVTVFGSARTPPEHPIYQQARELGRILSEYDLMVITGAGDGIMAAAHEGAGPDNSLGFNIQLPFEQHVNATLKEDQFLTFHFFFLRKLFFVKEADALVLCPGGFGTLDEALEVLTLIQTGKSPLVPIVLLDLEDGQYWNRALEFMNAELLANHYILPNDLSLMSQATSAYKAVEVITRFYSNYHSSRWLKSQFVIRMNHSLTDQALEEMQDTFNDICVSGGFSQRPYSDQEQDEPEFCQLTRLAFHFNGQAYGRLRELVNFINRTENWE